MIVVSNAGPLIALARINKLDLLKHFFNTVFISKGTYDEVVIKGKSKLGSKHVENAKWIKVKSIKNEWSVNVLRIDLDIGEAESIVLALELNANLLLMDELLARNIAESLGLKISGTVGILLKAKKLGLIDKIKPNLDELRNKKVWISDDVYKKSLKMADEM